MSKKSKYRRGFKVIQISGRTSAVWCRNTFQYKRDQTTKRIAGYGPLCVFDTWNHAEDFRCSLVPYFVTIATKTVACWYVPSRAKSVWTTYNSRRKLDTLPRGTILADEVTCLE